MSVREEEAARLAKLQKLREHGIDPYPAKSRRTHTIAALLDAWDTIVGRNETVMITGRLRTKREHGGLLFTHLEDGTGKIQVALKRDELGTEAFRFFDEYFDIGDILEVEGTLFKTKRGERTVLAERYVMLAKALAPLPEKWHGLTAIEVRYRKRYLDLIANEEVRGIFRKRAVVVRAIREFFEARGFMEVETPVLQPIPGGAAARPFITHHNSLDIDLYLRVAPELYLKRLLVGGFEKIYEIARCFRNEGIDHLHNPEFTQVEAYQAYADFKDFITLIEDLLSFVIRAAEMDVSRVPFEDMTIDFTPPYPRLTFHDAIKTYTGYDIESAPDRTSLAPAAKKLGLVVLPEWSAAGIMDELFKKFVRPAILHPTFITHHPIELSPLSKRDVKDPAHVERFQLLLGKGVELVNAFSELNDPIDQIERFRAQDAARADGEEAQHSDDDFVAALKHGMPPAAGLGLGIDRLAMLLCNVHNIKEVILFPTLRPE